MAERMGEGEMVSFEELLISNMCEQEALVLLLEEKGIPTRGEVLEKIKQAIHKFSKTRAIWDDDCLIARLKQELLGNISSR